MIALLVFTVSDGAKEHITAISWDTLCSISKDREGRSEVKLEDIMFKSEVCYEILCEHESKRVRTGEGGL